MGGRRVGGLRKRKWILKPRPNCRTGAGDGNTDGMTEGGKAGGGKRDEGGVDAVMSVLYATSQTSVRGCVRETDIQSVCQRER